MTWRHDKNAVVGLHLGGGGIDVGGGIEPQFEHLGRKFSADHDRRALADGPAGVQRGTVAFELVVNHGIEDRDNLAVDLHGIGDDDGVVEDFDGAFGQTGLTVAGGAEQEHGFLTDQRGPQLVEHFVLHDEVGKDAVQMLASDSGARSLGPDGRLIGPQRNGGRSGIMAGRLAFGGELVAGGGQTEQEVLTVGSADFDEFLLLQMAEGGLENRRRQLQLLVERDEGTDAVEIDPPCDQVHDQRPGDIEGLPIVWRLRNTSRSEGRLLHGRH